MLRGVVGIGVLLVIAITMSGCSEQSLQSTMPAQTSEESTPAATTPASPPSTGESESSKESSGESSGGASSGEEGSNKAGEEGGSGEEDEVGSASHATDSKFCSEHECIGEFETEPGTIVECADGAYSHSGGLSGACSHHGGER
jgi:hypothetical protein